MIGLGNVGTGVARYFQEGHAQQYNIHLTRVAVRDEGKQRAVPAASITTDPYQIIHDPDIDIVVEVMGGVDLATDYMLDAMKQGKHVVTANKASIAANMPALFETARENGVNLFFEASVAGGIPCMRLLRGYQGEEIHTFAGIINGTCNYVLSAMERGQEYADALATAQTKGIAEADPTLDVGGFDARDKLVVIIAMVHNTYIPPEAVYTEGITGITSIDVDFAEKYEIEEGGPGYKIKLLAAARRRGGRLEAHVYPAFISNDHPLAPVADTLNAVHIEGALCGPQTYIGKGAGQDPTASAVLSDVREVARNIRNGAVVELPAPGREHPSGGYGRPRPAWIPALLSVAFPGERRRGDENTRNTQHQYRRLPPAEGISQDDRQRCLYSGYHDIRTNTRSARTGCVAGTSRVRSNPRRALPHALCRIRKWDSMRIGDFQYEHSQDVYLSTFIICDADRPGRRRDHVAMAWCQS